MIRSYYVLRTALKSFRQKNLVKMVWETAPTALNQRQSKTVYVNTTNFVNSCLIQYDWTAQNNSLTVGIFQVGLLSPTE